jgi:hypothetical protein
MQDRLGLALYGLALLAFTIKVFIEIDMIRMTRLREKVWERREKEAKQARSVD